MADIFFSYKSVDHDRVGVIRDILTAQGFDVFWDQEVEAGIDWDTWIRTHLTQAKCVVVFWSKQSIESDNVRHEATIARRQNKLIPVLLDPLTAEQFPMGLYTVRAANLTDWKGDVEHAEWKKFYREIQHKLMPLWVKRKEEAAAAERGKAKRQRKRESAKPAPKIFISYRRDDSAGHAGRVHDRLERKFGRGLLFMDVDTIPLGRNFVRVLSEKVAQCDVLLAVIGPDWLTACDEQGERRLDSPTDLVRVEIGAALQRDIPVIPVLLDGAKIPKSDQLPQELKELALRNGINVRHSSFHSDMNRLIKGLTDQQANVEVQRQEAEAKQRAREEELAQQAVAKQQNTEHAPSQHHPKEGDIVEDAGQQFYLGFAYENGIGVEQDFAKAHEWYQKAADNGNEDAKARLDRIKMTKAQIH